MIQRGMFMMSFMLLLNIVSSLFVVSSSQAISFRETKDLVFMNTYGESGNHIQMEMSGGFKIETQDLVDRYDDGLISLSFSLTDGTFSGYIDQKYIVLSPRRENYRQAYLEFKFVKAVYRVEVELAMWSGSEKYNVEGNQAKAQFDYKNLHNGSWNDHSVNLLNQNLPTDRSNPITLTFDISEGTKEFRFYAYFNTLGGGSLNEDLGRICIGNMNITMED